MPQAPAWPSSHMVGTIAATAMRSFGSDHGHSWPLTPLVLGEKLCHRAWDRIFQAGARKSKVIKCRECSVVSLSEIWSVGRRQEAVNVSSIPFLPKSLTRYLPCQSNRLCFLVEMGWLHNSPAWISSLLPSFTSFTSTLVWLESHLSVINIQALTQAVF